MRLITTNRSRPIMVVLVVLALLFVGLSAFANPTLSSDETGSNSERDNNSPDFTGSEDRQETESEESNDETQSIPLLDAEIIDDEWEKPTDPSDPGEDNNILRPGFLLHATPMDGDGDGIADDVMIYASSWSGYPLGGVMIYIDGIYRGSTSFEGWIFVRDFDAGFHHVRGLYYQTEAYTNFRIQGPVQPKFGSLKGVVFEADSSGQAITPIGGAKVEIFGPNPILHAEVVSDDTLRMAELSPGGGGERIRYYDVTETNENGEFAFERIPEGRYTMRVSAQGYHSHKELVSIRGGEVTYLRIQLKAIEPGSLKGFVYGEEPTGPNVNPISGAKVEIFTPFTTPYPLPFEKSMATQPYDVIDASLLYYDVCYTHDDGSFSFEEVPEGKYMIRVSSDGFIAHRGTVVVKAGETTEVQIILKPTTWGALKGVVYEDDPTGPSVQHIEGALVEIYSPFHYPLQVKPEIDVTDVSADLLGLWGPFDDTGLCHNTELCEYLHYYARTKTDENGEFSFEKVAEGKYAIRVRADGYEEYRGFVKIEANEVTYERIPIIKITTGILQGFVIEEGGILPVIEPIAGAKVELFSPFPTPYPADELLWQVDTLPADTDILGTGPMNMQNIESTETDQVRMPVVYYAKTFTMDDGSFEFQNVPEGKYMMRVTAPGWHGHKEIVKITANEITTVSVELKPLKTGELIGTVYGEEWEGGPIHPVGNALVVLWNQWHYQYARTDKSGGFHMADVPSGEYTMYVFAKDFWPHKEQVIIRAGEVSYTRTILKPVVEKGSLKGNVYGEERLSGRLIPLEGAELKLVNHGNQFETTTGKYGEFSFDLIPGGKYILYVKANGWKPYKEEVIIKGGQVTYTRIILRPEQKFGSLKGVVLERGGGPISGPAKVTLFNQWYMESTITDRSGNFAFEKVPIGIYWLHVSAENYEEQTIKVEILPDQTIEVKIELEPLG